MILKLLLLFIIGLPIYRLLGGKLPTLSAKMDSKNSKMADEESMVECSSCGVFVALKEATLTQGRYVCNDCIEKRS